MIAVIVEHAARLGVAAVCLALGFSRATFYRWWRPVYGPARPRPSVRALRLDERQRVLETLHTPRFVDKAPADVCATLLDEGTYLCSERTMYRVLAAHGEVRERRDQLRHPAYAAPQLLATRPNELWSWDITKLLGPAKWTYFHLYVILDVFSRMVVGWMIASRESNALAEKLIRETCVRQSIDRDQLTVHADRGSSMTSKAVALLLADLGVTKTHSRPHVSNDNPYSEAQFKTLKYRHDFPERFGSIEDARAHCARFFDWYNDEHHHVGIGLLTPSDVHHGRAPERIEQRARVLDAAFAAHPERFVHGRPAPASPPTAVWINKPTEKTTATEQPSVTPASAPEPAPANATQVDALAVVANEACARQTQGDGIPLHSLPVSPRDDSRRIVPRQNRITNSAMEVTR
jgi:putative transposase